MEVYCTSSFSIKNGIVPQKDMKVLYLGTDYKEAVRLAFSVAPPLEGAVQIFHEEIYCALPSTIERTVLRYHNRDQSWASVVKFELKENE